MIIFLVFMAGPILASLALSFTDFGLRDLRNPLGTNFIGLDNYIELSGDRDVPHRPLQHGVLRPRRRPPDPGLGLAARIALDRGIRRFRTIFRVGYYLPVVTSIVAVAVVWRFVLNPDYGLLNMTLGAIGINGPTGSAADPRHALAHRDGRLAKPRLCHGPVPRRTPDHPRPAV